MYSLSIDVDNEAVGGTRDFATGASALRNLSPGTPSYPGWASYVNLPSPAKSWHGQISPGARQSGLSRSGSAASFVRAARSKKDLRFAASNNALEMQLFDTTSVANAVSTALETVNIETRELQLLEQHTSKALSLKETAVEAAHSKWLAPRTSEQPEQLCEVVGRSLEALIAQLDSSSSQLGEGLAGQHETLAELAQVANTLAADLARKEIASNIDLRAGALQSASRGGKATSAPSADMPLTPTQWRTNTATLCRQARELVRNSEKLRMRMREKLVSLAQREEVSCHNLLNRQRRAVSTLKCAISELERKLNEGEAEADRLRVELASYEQTLQGQEQSNTLTQERLELRVTGRPAEECVQDVAQIALQKELAEGLEETERLTELAIRQREEQGKLEAAQAELRAQREHKLLWLKLELTAAQTEIIPPMWETLHDLGDSRSAGTSSSSPASPHKTAGSLARNVGSSALRPFTAISTTSPLSPAGSPKPRAKTPDFLPRIGDA